MITVDNFVRAETDTKRFASFNNVGARKGADGSVTIRFGGDPTKPNFLPIGAGWNYPVSLYPPRRALLDGTWTFPAPQPAP